MLEGVDLADIHGQDQFNFQHAAISREDSKRVLDWAFRRDFERNGPSIYRICRTTLEGWLRYKNDPDPRVRARFAWEARVLRDGYAAALWAMEKHLRGANAAVAEKIRALRQEIGREFGLVSRLVARAVGTACCCGPPRAKSAAWPPAKPMNRAPSSNAATGRGPHILAPASTAPGCAFGNPWARTEPSASPPSGSVSYGVSGRRRPVERPGVTLPTEVRPVR